jgi:peptidyl-prolyl cis-trans isomerase SurA
MDSPKPAEFLRMNGSTIWRSPKVHLPVLLLICLLWPMASVGQMRANVPDTASAPPPAEELYSLDGIAAIVNDSVVLMSEVQEQTFFFASQQGISLADTAALAAARAEVLQRLIDEKVIVDEARKRGMTVSRDDVEMAVDGVIQDMIHGTGSEEAFREQLERENLTEEELRALYRPRLEAQILASRLVRREVNTDAEVTDSDIETYYSQNQDQFPERPETVRMAHIYVGVLPDSMSYVQARETAERLRERVVAGESFETLAGEFSVDPSARKGGDLGYFKKGQLDPRFEAAVFGAGPGQVAEVVQTRFGFHVIKVTDIRGDSEARASHILIPVVPMEAAVATARTKIESLKTALDEGADFADVAAMGSEDLETREKGGDLGYYAVADLTPDVREVISAMKPGDVSGVTEAPDGYHIFRLAERRPKGRFTLEETREDIRELIRREKLEEGYAEWIEELREGAYIEIKGG